jgi:hypothetical protein
LKGIPSPAGGKLISSSVTSSDFGDSSGSFRNTHFPFIREIIGKKGGSNKSEFLKYPLFQTLRFQKGDAG